MVDRCVDPRGAERGGPAVGQVAGGERDGSGLAGFVGEIGGERAGELHVQQRGEIGETGHGEVHRAVRQHRARGAGDAPLPAQRFPGQGLQVKIDRAGGAAGEGGAERERGIVERASAREVSLRRAGQMGGVDGDMERAGFHALRGHETVDRTVQGEIVGRAVDGEVFGDVAGELRIDQTNIRLDERALEGDMQPCCGAGEFHLQGGHVERQAVDGGFAAGKGEIAREHGAFADQDGDRFRRLRDLDRVVEVKCRGAALMLRDDVQDGAAAERLLAEGGIGREFGNGDGEIAAGGGLREVDRAGAARLEVAEGAGEPEGGMVARTGDGQREIDRLLREIGLAGDAGEGGDGAARRFVDGEMRVHPVGIEGRGEAVGAGAGK